MARAESFRAGARGRGSRGRGAGPSRSTLSRSADDGGQDRSTNSKRRKPKRRPVQDEGAEEEDAVEKEDGIGVNKIKAALRQTKRLLAKDKLSALARQEAERRLTALEDEMERRLLAQQERKNAKRSHKVRFFDRQKLTRRIAQWKRKLADSSEEGQQEQFELELLQNRILLNYVLEYVTLFPNNRPSPLDEEGEADDEESREARKRMKVVRERIVQAMEKGELGREPEIELQERAEHGDVPKASKRKIITGEMESKKADKGQKKKKSAKEEKGDPNHDLQDDDFFA